MHIPRILVKMCVPIFCGLSELTTLKEAKIDKLLFLCFFSKQNTVSKCVIIPWFGVHFLAVDSQCKTVIPTQFRQPALTHVITNIIYFTFQLTDVTVKEIKYRLHFFLKKKFS